MSTVLWQFSGKEHKKFKLKTVWNMSFASYKAGYSEFRINAQPLACSYLYNPTKEDTLYVQSVVEQIDN